MRLPSTSAANLFLLDPARRFVNFNQGAYPALQALSVLNRANDAAVIQASSSAQPIWANNAIGGAYVARNNPGIELQYTAGISGLKFSGAQFLEYDALAASFSGTEMPLTVVCQAQCASAGGTIWGFGGAGATPKLSLSYSGGTLSLTEVSSAGTTTVSATLDTNAHCITAVRSGNGLALRIDSASAAAPVSLTPVASTYTTFCVGAVNSGGSVSGQFNGALGKLAVYAGVADVYQVETYMLLNAGIIRGASSGLNSGF
jgi:hypothetical protein